MIADSDYKFFGLLAVALLTIGLAIVPLRWPKSRHFSFSQHVAARTSSIVYYAVLFVVTLPILNLFIIGWFVPKFEISLWFALLAIASSVAQIACTLVPEISGRRSDYHRLLAGISGLLLLPATMLLVFAPPIATFNKALSAISFVSMLAVIVFVSVRKGRPNNILWLQVVYYAAFFVPILSIAYLQ